MTKAKKTAVEYAAYLLGVRMYSTAELRRKLYDKEYPGAEIRQIQEREEFRQVPRKHPHLREDEKHLSDIPHQLGQRPDIPDDAAHPECAKRGFGRHKQIAQHIADAP